jgi:hypothetical protein
MKQACSSIRLDPLRDTLLKRNRKGLDFAKEANRPDGSGGLMLLALRTFKYDLMTGDPCTYTATGNVLTVVMAYVTTSSDDVLAYTKCKKIGTDVEGSEGPMIYEIPFKKVSFPADYEFFGRSAEDDIQANEMVHNVLKRLVEFKSCGAPASLDIALNQGSPLQPFGGARPLQDIIRFSLEVSALCSRSLAARQTRKTNIKRLNPKEPMRNDVKRCETI